MANIQQILNDEIRRLARKEVITLEKNLKAQLVELRKLVAAQNRRIKDLEKNLAVPAVAAVPSTTENNSEDAKSFRITPERIIKWRKSLGLKRTQYAKLLDVSPLSVAHWEQGKSTPRDAQKKRIAELRDLGKRQLIKLCEEKNIKLKQVNQASDEE